MVEGFDKELDFLLRQTAQSKTAFGEQIPDSRFQIPDSNHLDPDEISAFAENALPEKARQSYILHLAGCERCRKSLAGLIALNGEAKSESIPAKQTLVTEIFAPKIPWYRKLFAVPGLAYAMGALILIFAGVGIFTVLQNNSRNAEVSQTYEKQIGGGKGMSSDGDAATQEVYSSNQMSSNTAAMSNMSSANTMANASNFALSAAPTVANSNATAMRSEMNSSLRDRKTGDFLSEPVKPVGTPPAVAAGAMPPPPPPQANQLEVDDSDRDKESAAPSQNQTAQNQSAQNQTQITPDTKNAPRAPMPVMKEQKQEDKSDATRLAAKKKSAETTNIGGKTFVRGNNVWTDAAYRGQATTNVTRGTKEYRKLDSGLRGIVENLGGTVIVVWKEKAYRIQ